MRLWVQDSLSCMQISLQEAGGLSYFLGAADEVRPWWQLGARGPGGQGGGKVWKEEQGGCLESDGPGEGPPRSSEAGSEGSLQPCLSCPPRQGGSS